MERTGPTRIVYLDTHILVWLHDGLVERLSSTAAKAIEEGRLFFPPMAELELQHLHEIGRFRPTANQALQLLAQDLGLQRSSPDFTGVVAAALELAWTRDPFDRLIVAETLCTGGWLVTKDTTILTHFANAIW